jgi:hypothetical protein
MEEEEDDNLGYYPDGVKRTLTDVQIAIFRHSEIQELERKVQMSPREVVQDSPPLLLDSDLASIVNNVSLTIPKVSDALIHQLRSIDEEEEGSAAWWANIVSGSYENEANLSGRLRACYVENFESEIAQLDLWTAYQATFTAAELPVIGARELMTIVFKTFPRTKVQVLSDAKDSLKRKHVIKGLRTRFPLEGNLSLSKVQCLPLPLPDHVTQDRYEMKKSMLAFQIAHQQDGERYDPQDFIEEGEDRTHRRKAREEDEIQTERIELEY